MTLTLELPEDVAEQVLARPEKERHNFAVAAIRRGLTVNGMRSEGVPAFDPDETPPLNVAVKRIEALSRLVENWNGYDVAAPNPDAITSAKIWLESFHREVSDVRQGWRNPHVAANEEGDVSFQWDQEGKRLFVYVSPADAYYVKAWGPDVTTEMADGYAATPEARLSLWDWLTGTGENA